VARHVLREIRQEFLGESRAAAVVREQIADFLARHATEHPPPPILFRGEVGVGKSLLARLTHRAGPRADGPFVDFNCASLPDSLLEPELFGYEEGAFTGATCGKPGLLERAHRGTLFLDNVTELPEWLQAKLLKVLERRRVRRLGSTRDKPIDVWILTATYQDLREAIDDDRRYREAFNVHENENVVMENLYQQLVKLDLLIPPLRQRPDDSLLLAEHFLARVCAEHNLPPRVFGADARSALRAYSWPGNVREVKHVIERVAVRFAENDIITAAMLKLPDWSATSRRRRSSG
jgi:transcriptional regulator with PAS, ATPase and Fis domain